MQEERALQFRRPTAFARARFSRILTLAAIAGLAACSGAEPDSGPGAVSEGEAQALDEAASMLDERALPPEVLPETGIALPPADESETEARPDAGD